MRPNAEVTEMKDATLESFVAAANHNCADFIENSGAKDIEYCRAIHDLFTKAILNVSDPIPPTPIFFLGRAHSAFLGAVRVCTSYEVPEAYMILRGVLENALYAFFVAEKPEMAKIWVNRDKDKKAVKDHFKIGAMKKLLEERHPDLGKVVSDLYEQTIDYGAHPNVLATTSNIEHSKKDGKHHFQMQYLSGVTQGFVVCLKTVPAVGVAALDVFSKIYPERFEALKLNGKIAELKKEL